MKGVGMNLRCVGIAAALLMAANAASAQLMQDGKPAAPSPRQAESGGFAVIQMASDNQDRFHAEWETSTPGANLTTTTETVRNAPIFTFLVFTGCKADAAGNCNVTADFHVIGPQDKGSEEYSTAKDAPVWMKKPPAKNILFLSDASLGLRIEDKDPLGAYIVRAVVTDHVANITLKTEQTLTAVEAK
ncbi:hypothetical protein [Sphingomonas oligophenolica]